MLELYTAKGYHYKTDIYDVTLEASSAQENGKSTVSLATFDKVPVYYTTDGTEPDSTATLYTSPFTLTDSTTVVKAKAMRKGKPGETFSFDEEIKAAFRQ